MPLFNYLLFHRDGIALKKTEAKENEENKKGQVNHIGNLFVDEWERWEVEVTEKTKLGTICKALEKQFKLQTRDVILEATPIFLYALKEDGIPKN